MTTARCGRRCSEGTFCGTSRRIAQFRIKFRRRALAHGLVLAATGWLIITNPDAALAQATGIIRSESAPVRLISLTLNKSRSFRIDRPFSSSAVVGAPELLDAVPLTDHSLYLQGKKIGTTNVSVFDQSMRLIGILDVEVVADTGMILERIRATTGARGVRMTSSNAQVVLSGEVPDAVTADRVVSLAKSLYPDVPVINSMAVASAQQVMLKVRFLEVERTAARALGVNWFGGNPSGARGVNIGAGTPTYNPSVRPDGGSPSVSIRRGLGGAGSSAVWRRPRQLDQ